MGTTVWKFTAISARIANFTHNGTSVSIGASRTHFTGQIWLYHESTCRANLACSSRGVATGAIHTSRTSCGSKTTPSSWWAILTAKSISCKLARFTLKTLACTCCTNEATLTWDALWWTSRTWGACWAYRTGGVAGEHYKSPRSTDFTLFGACSTAWTGGTTLATCSTTLTVRSCWTIHTLCSSNIAVFSTFASFTNLRASSAEGASFTGSAIIRSSSTELPSIANPTSFGRINHKASRRTWNATLRHGHTHMAERTNLTCSGSQCAEFTSGTILTKTCCFCDVTTRGALDALLCTSITPGTRWANSAARGTCKRNMKQWEGAYGIIWSLCQSFIDAELILNSTR